MTLFRGEDISLNFDAHAKPLFSGLSFQLEAGDTVVLEGKSGSGKSCLLRTMAGLEPAATGRLFVRDHLVVPSPALRGMVRYVHQHPFFLPGTFLENIEELLSFSELKLKTGLSTHIPTLIYDLMAQLALPQTMASCSLHTLSGGEKQRLSLVRALLLPCNVLLLDEPTSSLDHESVRRVEMLLSNWVQQTDDRAYIWVTHDRSQAQRVARHHWHFADGTLEKSSVMEAW